LNIRSVPMLPGPTIAAVPVVRAGVEVIVGLLGRIGR
jgi:hypothetical protein